MATQTFSASCAKPGLTLDLKTQVLCHGNIVFINDEAYCVDNEGYQSLRTLADKRQLDANTDVSTAAMDLLYRWYEDGYIVLVDDKKKV